MKKETEAQRKKRRAAIDKTAAELYESANRPIPPAATAADDTDPKD